MNVRVVPMRDLPLILAEPWVDRTRAPFVKDDTAYVPVVEGYAYSQKLPERRRKRRGYQRLGDIIAFHGTRPDTELVHEVIQKHAPRGIIWYKGHLGEMRIPDIVLLYGQTGEILHKEAGITYRFDPSRIMFSQGNRQEKNRIAGMITEGEHVCDMFAGIGYFTLPMAKAGAYVHAIELNPDSVRYLERNSIENNLDTRITFVQGDCRNTMKETYDRIHMGHFDAITFLPYALGHVHSGTTLHIHGIGDITREIQKTLTLYHLKGDYHHRIIKKIGPGKSHTVTDVVIS